MMNKLYIFMVLMCSVFASGATASQDKSLPSVLIVGGAGYIGSHVGEMLYRKGYQTVVLDNLSCGNPKTVLHGTFIEGDIGDSALLDKIFTTYQIDAVFHFAAYKDVGESVRAPLKYYQNNVAATINLLTAMQKHNVNVFIFSSTAALFGMPEEQYITEEHPCHPISPYGRSKWMVEQLLKDLSASSPDFKYCCLRYFNAAGGDPQGEIKNYNLHEANLIPRVLRSLQKTDGSITIFGTDFPTPDGTGVRDYIHIEDLGEAHIAAMHALLNGASSTCYNLGNGSGFSVREVIKAVEKVTGLPVNAIEGARREGDPPYSLANADKARRELNWVPRFSSLETMIADTWRAMN